MAPAAAAPAPSNGTKYILAIIASLVLGMGGGALIRTTDAASAERLARAEAQVAALDARLARLETAVDRLAAEIRRSAK